MAWGDRSDWWLCRKLDIPVSVVILASGLSGIPYPGFIHWVFMVRPDMKWFFQITLCKLVFKLAMFLICTFHAREEKQGNWTVGGSTPLRTRGGHQYVLSVSIIPGNSRKRLTDVIDFNTTEGLPSGHYCPKPKPK
ncbi:hypothetical protein J6590_074532 [Homalodisca vitripennis]|nr:hypothetical protein J6590_074532 [Homalodisca vitripennis]